MSETPTTTTSQNKIAIHLPFVLQYASIRICIAVLVVLLGPKGKGNSRQYSSHLYRSTPPICIAKRLPFAPQYIWENLGGCGHLDVPNLKNTTAAKIIKNAFTKEMLAQEK